MNWSNEDRQGFLMKLDGVEQVVLTIYRLFLGLLFAAILAVVAFVVVRRPWGAGNQGEWFYFSISVLVALGWTVGQFVVVGQRTRRLRARQSGHSSNDGATWTWKFQFGTNAGQTQQNTLDGSDQDSFPGDSRTQREAD